MTLACAPAVRAASLPTVSSGQRPGPPLLYQPEPSAPPLSVKAPFAAKPLLVSGTDALRAGEYLFQDYLFDDRGADTVLGAGSRGVGNPGNDIASSTAGDVLYPTADRFAGNAADLVEMRIKPTTDAIVYRVTLNTVKDDDTAVVGLGIDTDRSGGNLVEWPLGAGVRSPGLDKFITAWGTGGEVRSLSGNLPTPLPPGAVSIDQTTNQMTIRVPRSLLDPKAATWRYVMGTGLWSGSGWQGVDTGSSPSADRPASGSSLQGAPAVFNLGFRFAEPQSKNPLAPYTTFPGIGNWFEDQQSRALAAGVTDCSFPGAPSGCKPFAADVDFAKLAAGGDSQLHSPPGREQARIYPSSQGLPEGVRSSFPAYGGQLQPYILTVPPGYDPGKPSGLTFSLHSLGGTYTQYAVFSPNQLRQFGDQRNNLVVTTLGHGTNGWYTDEAESDFFETWADVARHFSLDSERVALSGYSMGGYGTYKLGVEYPDLFGRAFTTVGPPARGVWVPPAPPMNTDGERDQDTNTNPLLENVRWVPFLDWSEVSDELVPYVGPRAQQARFDSLGLRSQLWSFSPGEHFTLAILDGWTAARDFLGESRVKRDPGRVNYAFMPAADRPKLGLMHDHAYWVSGLRVRDPSGDRGTDPARGEIDARSLVFGEGDPVTKKVTSAGAGSGAPQANTVEGTDWESIPRIPAENALDLSLDNVSAATIDGARARLSGNKRLRIKVRSDGGGKLRLNLALPANARVQRVEGGPVAGATATRARTRARVRAAASAPEADLDRSGVSLATASGTRTYVIETAAAAQDESTGAAPTTGRARDNPATANSKPRTAAGSAAGSSGGSLPFTGLQLLGVLLAGLALAASGTALRSRLARS